MIVLRHGQSEFNVVFSETKRDPGIEDPRLTALGEAQAEAAAAHLATRGIGRILVSPYTRALQTARAIGERCGLSLEITDLVREHYNFVCDVGTPRSVLERAWPDCDFSAIPERWWPDEGETRGSVAARAARFRALMAAEPAQADTVVVCHWGFGLALTGRALANGEWVEIDPAAPAPEVRFPELP
jgi:broad specificity phosphatase PhoE